jgi:hypothetical protein
MLSLRNAFVVSLVLALCPSTGIAQVSNLIENATFGTCDTTPITAWPEYSYRGGAQWIGNHPSDSHYLSWISPCRGYLPGGVNQASLLYQMPAVSLGESYLARVHLGGGGSAVIMQPYVHPSGASGGTFNPESPGAAGFVALVETAPRTRQYEGTFTAGASQATVAIDGRTNSIDSEVEALQVVLLPNLARGPNLLVNPDWETSDLSGWDQYNYGIPPATEEWEPAPGATYNLDGFPDEYVTVALSGDSGSSLLWQQVSVEQDSLYELRGWLACRNDATSELFYQPYGQPGNTFSPDDPAASGFVMVGAMKGIKDVSHSNNDFYEFMSRFYAPSDTVTVAINGKRASGAARAATIYLWELSTEPFPTPIPGPEPLLENWDFELGAHYPITGWEEYNYGGEQTWVGDSGYARAGSYGASLSGSPGQSLLWQTAPVYAGVHYELSGWLATIDDSEVYLYYHPTGAAGTTFNPSDPASSGFILVGSLTESTGNIFEEFTVSFQATGSAVTVAIDGRRVTGGARADEIWFAETTGPMATPATSVKDWSIYR